MTPLTYVSTRTPTTEDRFTVARCFDSYWTAEACQEPGERIYGLVGVTYATREPRPGDRLRVTRSAFDKVTGILPPHVNDDAEGNPIIEGARR